MPNIQDIWEEQGNAIGTPLVLEDDGSGNPKIPVGLISYSAVPVLRKDITSRTGGTASSLDGVVTVGGAISVDTVYIIDNNGFEDWQFVAGTDAEDGTTVVRPDDYAVSTNEFVWKRKR